MHVLTDICPTVLFPFFPYKSWYGPGFTVTQYNIVASSCKCTPIVRVCATHHTITNVTHTHEWNVLMQEYVYIRYGKITWPEVKLGLIYDVSSSSPFEPEMMVFSIHYIFVVGNMTGVQIALLVPGGPVHKPNRLKKNRLMSSSVIHVTRFSVPTIFSFIS